MVVSQLCPNSFHGSDVVGHGHGSGSIIVVTMPRFRAWFRCTLFDTLLMSLQQNEAQQCHVSSVFVFCELCLKVLVFILRSVLLPLRCRHAAKVHEVYEEMANPWPASKKSQGQKLHEEQPSQASIHQESPICSSIGTFGAGACSHIRFLRSDGPLRNDNNVRRNSYNGVGIRV